MGKSRAGHWETTIWQRRFWERHTRGEEHCRRRLDYIRCTPVKHGLVEQVADWESSTFQRYVREGIYPRGWSLSGTDPEAR